MAMVFRSGQMVPDMKVIGKITKLVEKVNFGMWMEMFSKVNGKMIKLMGMVFMSI